MTQAAGTTGCLFHARCHMQQPLLLLEYMTQRWRDRVDYYRPDWEAFNSLRYEVAQINDNDTPRRFINQHHYMHSYPAAVFRYGLYESAALVGVAVFSVPVNYDTYRCFKGFDKELHKDDFLDLGRFVLLDSVPCNAETWFLARAFDLLRREGMAGIVSFSDPMARRTAEGRLVFPGHIGVIYQAFNATFVGRTQPKNVYLFDNGEEFNSRTIQKIRKREQGWEGAARRLTSRGADEPWDDTAAWLRYWLEERRLCREARHPGNLKYCWAVNRRWRAKLPKKQTYPKAWCC